MNLKKILKHRKFWQASGLVVLDVMFFGNTNTANVPQFFLILGFLLLLINVYIAAYLLFSIMKIYGLPLSHKRRLSMFAAGFVGILIALQSIGELSPKDVLVLMPIAVISYLYLIYSTKSEQKLS